MLSVGLDHPEDSVVHGRGQSLGRGIVRIVFVAFLVSGLSAQVSEGCALLKVRSVA